MLLTYLARDRGRDPSFRLGLRARIRRLSAEARSALGTLGLAQEPLDRKLLGAGVDELRQAELVVEQGAAVAAWHPIAARLAAELLEPDEQAVLHARLAEAAREPGTAAEHYAAAGNKRDAYLKAVEAVATAESAARRAHFLAIAAESATGVESERLRLQSAGALLATGEYRHAFQLARSVRTSNPVVQAEAALKLASACLWLRNAQGAEAELARGVAAVTGTKLPVEVRLQVERARLVLYERDPERAGSLVAGARALANAAGVEQAAARYLDGLASRLRFLPEAADEFKAAAEMARDTGDDLLEADASAQLVSALELFGKPEEALTYAERMLSRARSLDQRGWAAVAQVLLARLDVHHRGRYGEAAAALEPLVDCGLLGPYLEEAEALRALALSYAGQETEGRSQITRSLARAPLPWARPVLLLARAEIEWLAGRSSVALGTVEELRAATGRGYEDLLAPASIFEGWALVDQGRSPPPAMIPPAASLAAVPLELRALGRLASPNGAADASGLFEQAAEAWARHRRSAELRCRWAAGEAARLSGSMTRAQALLRPLETAAKGRATSMLARVRTSLRKSGVAAAAGAAAVPRGRLPSRLTSREREILRFVGSGLSSRDIAHMLSISQSTVETQIRTAMRKLGATTRVQAATLVWFRTEDALLGTFRFWRRRSRRLARDPDRKREVRTSRLHEQYGLCGRGHAEHFPGSRELPVGTAPRPVQQTRGIRKCPTCRQEREQAPLFERQPGQGAAIVLRPEVDRAEPMQVLGEPVEHVVATRHGRDNPSPTDRGQDRERGVRL